MCLWIKMYKYNYEISMKRVCVFLGVLALLLAFSSCASRKKFVYLNNMMQDTGYPIGLRHEAVIHCDDRLDITVSCKNPELAIPFNIQGEISLNPDGGVSGAVASAKGYRVDVDGYIDFPVLGKLYVEGKTVHDVKNMITKQIVEGNYIKAPIVSIEFLNFKYTILGAVGSTGTYTVEGNHITLLDAIAKAGDLAPKARVDRVSVIREENGERKMYVHDLRDMEIFQSPAYYLQQNDIVYVEPKYKKQDTEDRGWKYLTLLLSVITASCSIVLAIK